jgi:hypothetical protein
MPDWVTEMSITRKFLRRLKSSAIEKADNLGFPKFVGLLPVAATFRVGEVYQVQLNVCNLELPK